ncbi:AMP-binding protein [Gordonia sp. CPCC 206044]|uniref:AMP-binding protein n=1 Tax=Gordonia sp. CPCC 206044 TaxID=3140793 RepID=UPI003AF37757
MPNLLDPVSRHAHLAPESVAVRGDHPNWSYSSLHARCLRYAGRLRMAGVVPGDRVLLAAPSVPEFVVAYLGVQVLGATVITVNTMSTEAEIGYYLDDTDAALAIGWHELSGAVRQAAAAASVPYLELAAEPSRDETDGERTDFGAVDTIDVVDRRPDDTAAILYTSGTTGKPKGAELTVANLLAAGEIASQVSRSTADDRVGTGLPLFHVFGQSSVMMSALTGGGSLSLLKRFTPDAMVEMIRRDRLTVVCGVPTMWNALLHNRTESATDDFAHLRIAVSGGASLPGEVARAFEARYGCTLLEGYGLTETAAMATFNDVDHSPKIVSTGRAVPRTEIEIRDPDGHVCAAGTVGEVYIKGPTVLKGYWRRPEATAAVLSVDGWFRTGDLGVFDEDCDLRIVDRVKDLIIRGGYNVYPGEVEDVLYEHPAVVEAAVVGVPDTHYGEEVAAVVVLRAGSDTTPGEIEAWCRERLSAYKIPRLIRFVDELPKGSTGKILKRQIDRADLRGART